MSTKRRKRFYYEIHLSGAVVDGTGMFTGMLEAEKAIDDRSKELVADLGMSFRGFIICQIGRRKKKG